MTLVRFAYFQFITSSIWIQIQIQIQKLEFVQSKSIKKVQEGQDKSSSILLILSKLKYSLINLSFKDLNDAGAGGLISISYRRMIPQQNSSDLIIIWIRIQTAQKIFFEINLADLLNLGGVQTFIYFNRGRMKVLYILV